MIRVEHYRPGETALWSKDGSLLAVVSNRDARIFDEYIDTPEQIIRMLEDHWRAQPHGWLWTLYRQAIAWGIAEGKRQGCACQGAGSREPVCEHTSTH